MKFVLLPHLLLVTAGRCLDLEVIIFMIERSSQQRQMLKTHSLRFTWHTNDCCSWLSLTLFFRISFALCCTSSSVIFTWKSFKKHFISLFQLHSYARYASSQFCTYSIMNVGAAHTAHGRWMGSEAKLTGVHGDKLRVHTTTLRSYSYATRNEKLFNVLSSLIFFSILSSSLYSSLIFIFIFFFSCQYNYSSSFSGGLNTCYVWCSDVFSISRIMSFSATAGITRTLCIFSSHYCDDDPRYILHKWVKTPIFVFNSLKSSLSSFWGKIEWQRTRPRDF